MVSTKSLAISSIALGIVFPVIAYVASRVFMAEIVSYGGPPNQGAMVLAYLVNQGALVVGACLVLVGLIVFIKASKKPFDAEAKNPR